MAFIKVLCGSVACIVLNSPTTCAPLPSYGQMPQMCCFTTVVSKLRCSFRFVSFRSPSVFYPITVGVEVVYFHFIILRHTHQSVGLLWTRDRPVAETSTRQHKHCTRDKHPCPQWDSNPWSQQELGRKLRCSPVIKKAMWLLGSISSLLHTVQHK
jgi:hypothetical protein